MTTIISALTDSQNKSISKSMTRSSSSSSKVTIEDLVPSGLDSAKVQLAIDAYLMGLPTTTGTAFTAIKNEKQLAYLNAALSSAINAINRFIDVYQDTTQSNRVLVSSTTAFTSPYTTNWSSALPRIKTELQVALDYLICYSETGNSLIDYEDMIKLKADFNDLIDELDSFNATAYVDFTSKAGLTIGQ